MLSFLLHELFLCGLALFDKVVDESFLLFLFLWSVLADKDRLHAEGVKALQIAAARVSLLLIAKCVATSEAFLRGRRLVVVIRVLGQCDLATAAENWRWGGV